MTPESEREGPAWRRLDIVALVVQAEAAILLLSPAIAFLVRDNPPDPRPGLVALIIAPILWRLGHGVAHASRVAIGIMAALVMLHLISIAGPTKDPVDVVVVGIEVIAVVFAFATMRKYQPPLDRAWNRELRWQTLVPIALAIAWSLFASRATSDPLGQDLGPLVHAERWLALLLIGTAIWLAESTRLLPRVARAFSGAQRKRPAMTSVAPVACDSCGSGDLEASQGSTGYPAER